MEVQLYDNLTDVPVPKRKRDGHKGTFGKVLIIAGFGDMTGACVLCSESALKAGSGLVKVYTSELTAGVLRVRQPELMVKSYEQTEEKKDFDLLCDWADVIAIGPGLSTDEYAGKCLKWALEHKDKAFVIDADALNILAKWISPAEKSMSFDLAKVTDRLTILNGLLPEGAILTPHVGELSRILGISAREITKNHKDIVNLSEIIYNGTIVMKDAVTTTVSHGKIAENHHGNDGMATGGSGDVLTGLIAALRAQGASSFEAAAAGVRIHAEAGERAAAKHSRHSMTAGDLILEFDGIFTEFENRE